MKLSHFLKIHLVFQFLIHHSKVSALRCYSCSVTSSNSDQICLNDPANAEGQSIVNCNKKYCTIFRQELKDPAGKINSFVRGCEEKPTFLDEVRDDDVFKTFWRSCTVDLCNSGDGKRAPGGIKISPDVTNIENMLVPGLPNASTSIKSSFYLFFPAVLLISNLVLILIADSIDNEN